MRTHDLDLYRRNVLVRRKPPVRLSVIDAGPRESAAPALVFLHGFGGYALQWAHQMLPLADTHRLVALDLRGHGLSDRPRSEYGMEAFQTDLERVIEALELPPTFVLVGHSFGGAIAATFAVAHPERVERLILIGTAVDFFAVHPGARMALRLPSRMLQPVARLFPKRLAAPARVLRAMYREALCRWDGNDVLGRVVQPTLVVMGERDAVFDRKAYDAVPDCIPHCQVVKVSVSAHLVHLERSDAVNRALARFLRGGPSWTAVAPEPARAPDLPWIRHYELGVPTVLSYPRLPVHQLLDAAAQRYPRRRALIFGNRSLTYERLREASDRMANAWIALGIEGGDRVAVLLENSPALVTAHFGLHKAGAVVVSLQPATAPEELTRQMESAGVRALVADPELLGGSWPRTPAGLTDLVLAETVASSPVPLAAVARDGGMLRSAARSRAGPAGVRRHSLRALLERAWQAPPHVPIESGDGATIEFSSGSTGTPKAVLLSHENLVVNVLQVRHWLQDIQDGREVVLCALDLSHSYGATTCMNLGISMAATLVLLSRPGTAALLAAIQRHRPTIFPGVPDMYLRINQHPRVRRFDLKSIRACVSGAAPLPREVQEVFERLTRGRLAEGYGLTEAGPVTHINPLHGLRKPGSIGVPLPGTEARIVDLETRDPLPPSRRGELEVRGPQVMKGYVGDRGPGPDPIRDGWLATGDVAWMDEDGFFFVVGRVGESFRVGSHVVYPREVEEVVHEHPDVLEVAVTRESDGAERLVAHVVARDGRAIDAADLGRFCAARLPAHAVPGRFALCASLPRAALGKILRRKLESSTEASG